ncbi:TPA: 50S ribosomal protein L20 [Patescibacteria group bacterium]|nr:50S ribosomal protein L20 [Patescibacteria group bacterium]
MVRIKRGLLTQKKHRKLRQAVKGFRTSRKHSIKLARQAYMKAGVYAYRDRKAKKRTFRSLWITRINAALQPLGLGYNKFINLLTTKNIAVDRKILAQLAHQHPQIFNEIVAQLNK